MGYADRRKIETLKSEGKFYAAGYEAGRGDGPRSYGCHFGMRSTREAAMAEFYQGYDDAQIEKAQQRLKAK